jgi:hypothetical protein
MFVPFWGSLVYFPCIRVAPLCAIFVNCNYLSKNKNKIRVKLLSSVIFSFDNLKLFIYGAYVQRSIETSLI